MDSSLSHQDVNEIARAIEAELAALPARNTPSMRLVRKKYSQRLKDVSARFMLALARELIKTDSHRWIAFELIHDHPQAFACVGEAELQEFGEGINSWWRVDEFARTLSGPAWLRRQIPDDLIWQWAHSSDRWWRRAALVSTVALNVRSQGGLGDLPRTLRICKLLVADHDDMVVKALSWALRELAVHEPEAVESFLREHDSVLAGRVKREVRCKMETGLKNPRR